MLTISEENYVKSIFTLGILANDNISTNDLAEKMNTKASSVTDMLKKLSEKQLVEYQKYQGCSLTEEGMEQALLIVRKHRLWETFLVDKLGFQWDQVHDIAEQLEHIQSNELIDRLEEFLGFPKVDPHGEPIPNREGKIASIRDRMLLADAEVNSRVKVIGVKDGEAEFLQYLLKIEIQLGTELLVQEKLSFDGSISVLKDTNTIQFSKMVSKQIYVTPI
jgi:DtxR family Mn-dependent transcriptional regulator